MRAEEGWKTGSVLLEALTTNFSIFCCDNSLSADTKMMMMMHVKERIWCKDEVCLIKKTLFVPKQVRLLP
jgi:hypothetical protein